jgi:NADH:ubiquinone oxidoreductase subunit 4 (subunit M)
LLLACTNAALICFDAIAFYVLFEATSIPLLALVTRGSVWHRGSSTKSTYQSSLRHKPSSAYRMLAFTILGSLLMLPLLLALFQEVAHSRLLFLWTSGCGSSFWAEACIWASFMIVFCIKIPLLPAHLWLPEAHVAAPTAGSVLLSGIFLKLGGFGLVFVSIPIGGAVHAFAAPLVSMCVLFGSFYAALATLRQLDLKRIVAYSSIVHMAMLPLVLVLATDWSTIVGMWLMVAHGVVSPALFVLVGQLYDRHHTEFVSCIAVSGHLLPCWRSLFFLVSLGNAAIPLTPGFLAEFVLLLSLFSVQAWFSFSLCALLALPTSFCFLAYARVSTPIVRDQTDPDDLLPGLSGSQLLDPGLVGFPARDGQLGSFLGWSP